MGTCLRGAIDLQCPPPPPFWHHPAGRCPLSHRTPCAYLCPCLCPCLCTCLPVRLQFLKKPVGSLYTALCSTIRSSSFLASFVAVYMAAICVARRAMPVDNKLTYYFAGLVSSLSVLLEEKSRRSELALYVLPRAMDSLFMILQDRRWLSSMRHGESVLFCASMAGLMFFHQVWARGVGRAAARACHTPRA